MTKSLSRKFLEALYIFKNEKCKVTFGLDIFSIYSMQNLCNFIPLLNKNHKNLKLSVV